MVITNISEAKATLSRLIEQVLNGQEVIIGKAGKPVAKLVPYTQDTSPRQLGAGQRYRLLRHKCLQRRSARVSFGPTIVKIIVEVLQR